MKKLIGVERRSRVHWVGDGFPVRTIFSHATHGAAVSPFLLLDYAGPAQFPPSDKPRGVEEHPHRGFETVTIVYSGEVEHRDSSGGGGKIGAGDVQWMTAASGLVHEEMHGREFTRQGGVLEMVQLWVNLPARDKQAAPGYQSLSSQSIPTVPLPGASGAGSARVIAGELLGVVGPAKTFTPIDVWDVKLAAGASFDAPLRDGRSALVLVLRGALNLSDEKPLGEAGLAIFDTAGEGVRLAADVVCRLLVLSGEPIDEPVVAYGPFVMNTQEEIRQAIADYRSGRMGQLSP